MDSPTVTPYVMAILAVIIPPIVSFLKSCNAPTAVNQGVAMGVSLAAGVLSTYIDRGFGEITVESVTAFAAVAFTLSQLIYQTMWRYTPANALLEQALWGPPAKITPPPAPVLDAPREPTISPS